MTALYIILGIIALIVILFSIKVSVTAEYADSFSLDVQWLFIKLHIFPQNEEQKAKREAKKAKKEEKKKKKEEKEKIDPKLEAVYHDLEEQMKGILGTKVCINHKDAKKGKLEIEYYSQDELDRIIDMIRTIQK